MTNEIIEHPGIKSLILGTVDLESYKSTVLQEAQMRVVTRQQGIDMAQAEKAEASRGLAAAEYADIDTQIALWRTRYWRADYRIKRRTKQLESAQKFLSLAQDGYLPIPTLPGGINPRWLRDPLPPEVLETLGVEDASGRFTEFQVIGGTPSWGRGRRRAHRDPILVGICDGEMFPLAWWR